MRSWLLNPIELRALGQVVSSPQWLIVIVVKAFFLLLDFR